MKAIIWIIVIILLVGLGMWWMKREPAASTTYEPTTQDGTVSGASTGPAEETIPGEYEDKG